jgi:hypothetical protein
MDECPARELMTFGSPPRQQRQRERRVPQVVEPDHRYPGLAARRPEVPAHVVRVQRRASAGDEGRTSTGRPGAATGMDHIVNVLVVVDYPEG